MVPIATLRQQKGWTQAELADRLGVSRVTVARWETGQRTPDRFTIAAIARVFGTKIANVDPPTPAGGS